MAVQGGGFSGNAASGVAIRDYDACALKGVRMSENRKYGFKVFQRSQMYLHACIAAEQEQYAGSVESLFKSANCQPSSWVRKKSSYQALFRIICKASWLNSLSEACNRDCLSVVPDWFSEI